MSSSALEDEGRSQALYDRIMDEIELRQERLDQLMSASKKLLDQLYHTGDQVDIWSREKLESLHEYEKLVAMSVRYQELMQRGVSLLEVRIETMESFSCQNCDSYQRVLRILMTLQQHLWVVVEHTGSDFDELVSSISLAKHMDGEREEGSLHESRQSTAMAQSETSSGSEEWKTAEECSTRGSKDSSPVIRGEASSDTSDWNTAEVMD